MAYEVLARKWRPQQFDDIIGQRHVTETLRNAIETDHVAHAYLFVGPRGTGKTTTARILAKALNCEKGPTSQPCDACDACREITAGTHLDVLEIDGASNTGVDHVRDLRDNVKFAPARGPFKIYIIDEVHMLSIGAFNALLKTLEEPPKHVKFVFATTEPQKIPATILSRCQRFDLRRISGKDIVARLSEIAAAEEVSIDDRALLAIARGAEGGMRDAQSALDQLIAFRGKAIREEDVLSVFGLVAQQTLDDLVSGVLDGDIPRVIEVVAELDAAGKDMQRLVVELLDAFRNLLIRLSAGDTSSGLELTDVQLAGLECWVAKTDTARVLRVVNLLIEAEGRMRYALTKRVLLETALVRSARAATSVSIDGVLDQLNKLKAAIGNAGVADEAQAVPAEKKTAPGKAELSLAAVPSAEKPPVPRPEPAPELARAEPDATADAELLTKRWHEVVDHVGEVAPLARNYLLDAKPVAVTKSTVQIGFDPEFADSHTKINYPRNVKALEKTLGDMLNRPVSVEFCILSTKDTLPGDTKFESENGKKPKTAKTTDPERRREARQSRDEWVKNPTVRKTLEMFNGDIVDIRE